MVKRDHDDSPAKPLGPVLPLWRHWPWLALATVLVLAWVYGGEASSIHLTVIAISATAVAGVVAYVLIAAVRLHGYRLGSRQIEYIPFDPGAPETPAFASDAIRDRVAELTPLGFVVKAHLARHEESPSANITQFHTFCENQRASDFALFLVVHTRLKIATKLKILPDWQTALAFVTFLANDVKFVTDNSKMINPLPPKDDEIRWQLPGVQDIGRLYAIHKELFARCGRRVEAHVPALENPAAYSVADELKMHAKWVERGFAYYDKASELYRLTWKGAFFAIWRGSWPMSAIRQALLERRARRVLETSGV